MIVRLSAAFHPAKRHGEQNAERPRNADGERMFPSNTAGAGRAHGGAVLYGGALMRLCCGEQSDDKPLAKAFRLVRHLAITFTCYHIPGRICT